MNTINKIVIYGKDRKEFYLNESVSNKIEFQNNLIEHLLKVSMTNQSIALMYQERNEELERKEYAVPKHTIYISVNYPDGCDIIGNGTYPEDRENITICINPKSGYKFKRWTKGTNTTSNIAYVSNIKSDLYFEAELEKLEPIKDINISVICDTSMGNYSQNKNSDGSITLVAFTNFGYNFKGWYNSNGNYISSSNSITLTESLTVLPKFEVLTRTEPSQPEDSGTSSGGTSNENNNSGTSSGNTGSDGSSDNTGSSGNNNSGSNSQGGIIIPQGTSTTISFTYPIVPAAGGEILPKQLELNIYENGQLIKEIPIDSSFNPKFRLYKNINLLNAEFRGSTYGYDHPYVLKYNERDIPLWAKTAYNEWDEIPTVNDWNNDNHHPLIIKYSDFYDINHDGSASLDSNFPTDLPEDEGEKINVYAKFYENNRIYKLLSEGENFETTGKLRFETYKDAYRFCSLFSYGASGNTLVYVDITIPDNIVLQYNLKSNKLELSTQPHLYYYSTISTLQIILDEGITVNKDDVVTFTITPRASMDTPIKVETDNRFWIKSFDPNDPTRERFKMFSGDNLLENCYKTSLFVDIDYKINGVSINTKSISVSPIYCFATPALQSNNGFYNTGESFWWYNSSSTPEQKTITITANENNSKIMFIHGWNIGLKASTLGM